MRKKIFVIVFALISLLALPESVDTMKKKLDTIKKNIELKNKNVIEVKQKQNEEKKNLNVIQNKLNVTKENYYKTENKYNTVLKKIDYTEKNLKKAQDELGTRNSQFRAQVTKWYKYGEKSSVEYLLGGSDFYDISDRYDNIRRIVVKNKTDIVNIGNIKKKIEVTKDKLEGQKEDLYVVKKDLSQQKVQLDLQANEKNKLIVNLKNKEALFQQEIEKLKKEKAGVEKEIQRIIAAMTKKAQAGKPAPKKVEYSEARKKTGKMEMPVSGTVVLGYGASKEVDFGAKTKISGIEIKSRMGERVKAAADGSVIFANNIDTLGKVVIIDNGNGVHTLYVNLVSITSSVGQKVKKGDSIAILGLSRHEREPRLYFEVRVNSQPVDPMGFLN